MNPRRSLFAVAGLAAVLGLGMPQCGGAEEEATETSVEVTEERDGEAEEREGQADDARSAERPVNIDLSGEDYTDRHPNGTTLQVVGMEVRRNAIAVKIDVVNGHTDTVELTGRSNAGAFLIDDTGVSYKLSRPEENPDLELGPGDQLTGMLVFFGRVPPEASSVTLKMNVYDRDDEVGGDDRYDQTSQPRFQIDDIPLTQG